MWRIDASKDITIRDRHYLNRFTTSFFTVFRLEYAINKHSEYQ
jgi:hypothetical protein